MRQGGGVRTSLKKTKAMKGKREIDFSQFKLVLAQYPKEFGKYNQWLYLFEKVFCV